MMKNKSNSTKALEKGKPNPQKPTKKPSPQVQPQNPRPDSFPAKESERTPGVKPKNLPHDPMKTGSTSASASGPMLM